MYFIIYVKLEQIKVAIFLNSCFCRYKYTVLFTFLFRSVLNILKGDAVEFHDFNEEIKHGRSGLKKTKINNRYRYRLREREY